MLNMTNKHFYGCFDNPDDLGVKSVVVYESRIKNHVIDKISMLSIFGTFLRYRVTFVVDKAYYLKTPPF